MRYFLALLPLFWFQTASASVNLLDKDDWKIDMSGFVETDMIYDSVRGFSEVIGNTPVAPNGTKGQTQFSIRNSRLAFNLQAPELDGWKPRGYFEFDLMGYDPSVGTTQTESSFYNNPSMRVRHAYLSTDSEHWQFLTGQTWALMGWQPYYFIPTIQVAPIPGMLYSRTAQVRVTNKMDLSENSTLQMALGIMRPPERNAQLPALEGGARWALNSWTGAFTGGATGSHKPQPLSIGLSGTLRDLEVATDTSGNTTSLTGYAGAVDILVPVLRSRDGKDSSNNLVIGGEFTVGQGYGDQFSGWTGGQFSPLSASATAPDKNNQIDPGIVGPDDGGSFDLIKLQTMNVYAQYHLPERWKTWLAAGYSQLYSSNIGATDDFKTQPYYKEEAMFANISHDCTNNVRVGFEWAQIKTSYTDNLLPTPSGLESTAPVDNRFQVSTWFIF